MQLYFVRSGRKGKIDFLYIIISDFYGSSFSFLAYFFSFLITQHLQEKKHTFFASASPTPPLSTY